LRRSGLVSIRFTGHSSQAHKGDDLMNYGALGPFVRSFILLVDPRDICPPQRDSYAFGIWIPHSSPSAKGSSRSDK
jgi:hypothetical protein